MADSNHIYSYQQAQFDTLRSITIAICSLSLASSLLVISVFIYMLIYHRHKTDRVSLRCVFMCCLCDFINVILHITTAVHNGNTAYCKAFYVVRAFLSVFSSSLLTLVGINLLLIFVINVTRKDLLEKFYYPSALIYALVSTIVPIYVGVMSRTHPKQTEGSCWLITVYKNRSMDMLGWVWYYSFIFFVNVIAIICSISAMAKLIQEQRQFVMRLQRHSSPNGSSTNLHLKESVKKQHYTVFAKVVLRCIFYPLGIPIRARLSFLTRAKIVPFLVNIFGFINELTVSTTAHSPVYAMTVLSAIFSSLGGFLVALVFFTDPAITSGISHILKNLRKKYVEEYTVMLCEKPDDRTGAISPTSTVAPSVQSSLQPLNRQKYAQLNTIYEIRPIPMLEKQPEIKYSKMIMRRIQLPSTNTQQQEASSSNVTLTIPHNAVLRNANETDFITTQTMDTKYSFIPYKYPWLATSLRFILTGFGTRSQDNLQHQPYDYPPLYELICVSNVTLLQEDESIPHLYTTSVM